MSDDLANLLAHFKRRRRHTVRQLVSDGEHTTAAQVADIQTCIAAIEAVMQETPEGSIFERAELWD